jgi:hypothetical protein
MDYFGINGSVAAVAASPGKTALGLNAATTTRARINQFVLSVGGTPVADNILDWQIRRFTTLGTSTPVTPVAKDAASPASLLTAGNNYSAEPTFTTTLFDIAVHQRSLFQWNAAPGSEILTPATANNGVGVTPIHASYNGSAQASLHWFE